MRILLVTTALVAMSAFQSAAFAESDSPWLPIPGGLSVSLNHTQQSGDNAFIGDKELSLAAITSGGASKYKRATTTVRAAYGLTDALSLDAAIGYGKVRIGAADNSSGATDTTLGLNWRVLDEFERPALPTLTLRAAGILKGNYDGARLAALGKDANGIEVAAVLGKELTPAFALWGEIGVQRRSADVPRATFFELGARWRLAPMWNATLGYSAKKFSGGLDIGGPGFSPARFQQVREERSLGKVGLSYAIAGNQGVALNFAKLIDGRNTVKDDQVIGVSYTFAF